MKADYHHIMTIKEGTIQTVIWSEETPEYRGIMIVTDDLHTGKCDVKRKGKPKPNLNSKYEECYKQLDEVSKEIDNLLKELKSKNFNNFK